MSGFTSKSTRRGPRSVASQERRDTTSAMASTSRVAGRAPREEAGGGERPEHDAGAGGAYRRRGKSHVPEDLHRDPAEADQHHRAELRIPPRAHDDFGLARAVS